MYIKLFVVFFTSIITVIITRNMKNRFSHLYFSINQILISNEDNLSLAETIFLFLPTFVGSFILSLIFGQDSFAFVLLYGFFTPFLIIWPVLVYGKQLLPYEAYRKMNILYLLYGFYTISLIFISYGGFISSWSLYSFLSGKELTFNHFLDFYANTNPFFQNMIWIAIASLFGFIVKSLKRKILRGSNE